MLTSKIKQYGRLPVTTYDFEVVGDVLDMHTHGEADVHISIIARGSFRVFGPGFDLTVKQGAILDWKPGQWHGFEALENNSRLINVVKA